MRENIGSDIKREKKLKYLFAVAPLFVILFLIVLSSEVCTGIITTSYCCPNVTYAKTDYDWVCPADCPGGGVTKIHYTVEFKDQDNEVCDPSDLVIKIRNVTDGVDLPQHEIQKSKGIYEGTEYITLSKDTKFEINVSSKGCENNAIAPLMVHVVNKGSFYDLCYSGKLPWLGESNPKNAAVDIPFNAGPGVRVDKIQNLNRDFTIKVMKDTRTEILPPDEIGTSFRDFPAAGYWTIGLTTEKDFKIYNDLMSDPHLCVRIFLKCDCNQ